MQLIRFWNTVKYLKPIQIEYQILKRLKKTSKGDLRRGVSKRELHLFIEGLDSSGQYVSRFQPERIFGNEVCLLNKIVTLDYSGEYMDSLLPLYRFNLLYFEYAIAWGVSYRNTHNAQYAEKFQQCFERYLDADVPYYAYVCSLQIPNLLIAMELFGDAVNDDFQNKVYDEIYREYRYIERHLERYLLGNHYFENIKALVIASCLFQEDENCARYFRLLRKEIGEQILSDGMHFELSPMYHKIILEDLLRIGKLPDIEGTDTGVLQITVEKMVAAMNTLEEGFNRTPLFNDAGDNVAKSKEDLQQAAKEIFHVRPRKKDCLPEAGYYRFENHNVAVLFDAGEIGPDYMPGHGHCDCLSYELAYRGEPFIVNAGTFQYQGRERSWYRSTAAHNTLQVENREQSDVWGEHRVAGRIRNVNCDFGDNFARGQCVTYQGDKLYREISLKNHVLQVKDRVVTACDGKIMSYIHIAPSFAVDRKNDGIEIKRGHNVIAEIRIQNARLEIVRTGNLTRYAPEFGLELNGSTLYLQWENDSEIHGYSIEIKEI